MCYLRYKEWVWGIFSLALTQIFEHHNENKSLGTGIWTLKYKYVGEIRIEIVSERHPMTHKAWAMSIKHSPFSQEQVTFLPICHPAPSPFLARPTLIPDVHSFISAFGYAFRASGQTQDFKRNNNRSLWAWAECFFHWISVKIRHYSLRIRNKASKLDDMNYRLIWTLVLHFSENKYLF